MKLKIVLLLGVISIYFMATYCMLNGRVCKFYKDYYLLNNRSISLDDEVEFTGRTITGNIDLFRPYFFSENHESMPTIGFSHTEKEGIWTVGNISKIAFVLPDLYSDVSIIFNIKPYINNRNSSVSAKVYINGEYNTEWLFKLDHKMPETIINMPQEYANTNPRIELTFIIDGMVSPGSLGYGDDRRKLGLFFKDVTFSPNMNSVKNTLSPKNWRKKEKNTKLKTY